MSEVNSRERVIETVSIVTAAVIVSLACQITSCYMRQGPAGSPERKSGGGPVEAQEDTGEHEMSDKKQLKRVWPKQAACLKKAGFDWETHWYYNTANELWSNGFCDYNRDPERRSAPTVVFALKWLRDVKGLPITVEWNIGGYAGWLSLWGECGQITDVFKNYEDAEFALLDAALARIETEK